MDQDKFALFQLRLQTFIRDNLVKTCYNDDRANFKVDQYHSVCDLIYQLYCEDADAIKDILKWSNTIIPTVEQVDGSGHMQNIGISASTCLEVLKTAENREYLHDTEARGLVEQFLNIVKKQAQDACSEHLTTSKSVSLTPRDIETLVKQYIANYITDFDVLTAQKKKEFDEITSEVKSSVDEAKASAAKAESSTKIVQNSVTTMVQNLNGATAAANKATEEAKNAAAAAENANEISKNMFPNMLSALGIFVGIVIAVMACYLSILLTEHCGDSTVLYYSRPFEFMRYLLMGHITLAVVFLLMYLISRISGHSLACSCNKFNSTVPYAGSDPVCDCSKCDKSCSVAVRFKLRYPYLYGINLACTFGYMVLAIWQFVNVYFRKNVDRWILNNGAFALIIISIGIIIFFVVLGRIFRYKDKS